MTGKSRITFDISFAAGARRLGAAGAAAARGSRELPPAPGAEDRELPLDLPGGTGRAGHGGRGRADELLELVAAAPAAELEDRHRRPRPAPRRSPGGSCGRPPERSGCRRRSGGGARAAREWER